MLRRELIFLHSASGDGCNDRPLLLATQEDFYRPVCIGSTGTFASPACSCPSSDNLRLIRRFEKGGFGSSGLEFRQPAADAASVGLRWLLA